MYLTSNPHKVHVYTDHKNLQRFLDTKELTRRYARWAEWLGQVKFRIIYRKGTENARADALSRRVNYKQDVAKPNFQMLKEEKDRSIVYANPQVMMVYRVRDNIDQELI
jgi:hypothetical protein